MFFEMVPQARENKIHMRETRKSFQQRIDHLPGESEIGSCIMLFSVESEKSPVHLTLATVSCTRSTPHFTGGCNTKFCMEHPKI